ncbi:ATP synthase F1 subunit epsilon [Candidatus Roizmanbacteria bacterium CG10_big_fil_rev_8_21_14_0_10_45_7]|uniref:ATP synthase epsilon chain n=1 Tax=Candidatus Roizmanbacteria bacterium CG10_big_fil_rev_8_21_14_0_10_45_7 TaxID=1974854 RepID=A0A2M8KUK4_9BACT|nr:MAG: ATP synthase F1 subunit epsilon [Candidatus Roizmanbacteria bacterium CG10_big_fil_rev_8_21_14_0_10_45_7]
MKYLNVRILTPEKQVYQGNVQEVTCTTPDGEISILPNHMPLLSLLEDGVVILKEDREDRFFSAGSGFIETDGKEVRILISRAYGQQEIDEEEIKLVRERAQKLLEQYPEKKLRAEAFTMLKRATIDSRILKKLKVKRR